VATHGLIKKSNKTPPAEIRKAEQLRREYFEEKRVGKKIKSK
jgi:phage-related protein